MKALGHDTIIHFDGKHHERYLSQDLIHHTNLALVFQKDTGVEIGHLFIHRPLANELGVTLVKDLTGFNDFRGRTFVATKTTSSTAATSSSGTSATKTISSAATTAAAAARA